MFAARGFTLTELLLSVTIAVILLALAVPGLRELLERRRLEGAGEELSTDLQYARSEAVSRQLDVALATSTDGRSYTITAATTPSATLLKTVTMPNGISLSPGVTLTYTALRGAPHETSGGDVSILVGSAQTTGRLLVTSNFMGRVHVCSPSGSLKGYSPC